LAIASCVTLIVQLACASAASAAWAIERPPNPAGATDSALSDVSCPAPGACIAVGHFTDRAGAGEALAERRDGRRWTIERTPTPADASTTLLFGVGCATPRWCVAVGSMTRRSGVTVPLAERWDGRRWSVQRTPTQALARRARVSYFAGVSCSSRTSCAAVGHSGNSAGSTGTSLAERWDGRRWTIVATPNPPGTRVSFLSAISCTSVGACTAVGYAAHRSGLAATLIERWNGSRWTIQQSPTPLTTASVQLTGVSCATSASCTAVGFFNAAGIDVILAERWNGSRWSIERARYPAGARAARLAAVSCSSTRSCTAVGSFSNRVGVDVTLAERRAGERWSVQRTLNPAGSIGSTLAGVACWSATRCVAVGSATSRSGKGTALAQRSS
jgi:hypothetical protein